MPEFKNKNKLLLMHFLGLSIRHISIYYLIYSKILKNYGKLEDVNTIKRRSAKIYLDQRLAFQKQRR